VGAVGQPILYLLGLAVGLAALITVPIVDHGQEVSYLMFVAPAEVVRRGGEEHARRRAGDDAVGDLRARQRRRVEAIESRAWRSASR
jgi:hypothetical protein